VNPAIPVNLEAVIQKAMQVKPELRYQTFDALRLDLDRLLQEVQ
jgi:hypothetical protein